MKLRYILVCFLVLHLTGCFDIFKSREKYIIGNISVIDPNDHEGSMYGIVYHEKEGFNSNIVEDFVISLYGNKTELFLQCLHVTNCNSIYYRVQHNDGNKPISVFPIDSVTYFNERKAANINYQFYADVNKCPYK